MEQLPAPRWSGYCANLLPAMWKEWQQLTNANKCVPFHLSSYE
jgi:hypothetical protein